MHHFPDSNENKIKRIAVYSRMSAHSTDRQREEAEARLQGILQSQTNCIPAGVFLESAADGSRKEARPELERLTGKCRRGAVDRILVESLGSFSRNTADAFELVRRFSEWSVELCFIKEGLDTAVIGADVLISLLQALAKTESRSRSGYMKKSIQERFRNGTYRSAVTPYGFRQTESGLEVDPAQAEIVREVFSMVLSGTGAGTIRDELNRRGIPGPMGGKWSQSELRKLISNPVYMGDAVFQQTYMDDQFRQQMNRGEKARIHIEQHHDPIITPEAFHNAQLAVKQRGKECGRTEEVNARSGRASYCFTGILRCKRCGAVMHRHTSPGGNISWLCHTHVTQPDRCDMKPVNDRDLKGAFLNVLNKLAWVQDPEDGSNPLLDPIEEAIKSGTLGPAQRKYFPGNEADAGSSPAEAVIRLRDFLKEWRITDDTSAFPDEAFRELVIGCTADSGKSAEFFFRVGIRLEESLMRTEVEEAQTI